MTEPLGDNGRLHPLVGERVLYKLTAADAAHIHELCPRANPHTEGVVVPADVVRVIREPMANLQLLPDGQADHMVWLAGRPWDYAVGASHEWHPGTWRLRKDAY